MTFVHNPFPISQSVVRVDLGLLAHNIRQLRNVCHATTRLMAVVKANAYGHGAVAVATQALTSGAGYLGVARMSEAIELRNAGITAPILLFGDAQVDHLAYVADQEIRLTISSDVDAQWLSQRASELGVVIKAHIKVDTGMGRLGLYIDPLSETGSTTTDVDRTVERILEIVRLGNIDIEGIYTHLANADSTDKKHALQQIGVFKDLLMTLERKGFKPEICHAANSAATINIPQAHFDMVRPGIAMYGLWPSDEVANTQIDLKPAMSILSKIIHLKKVPPGFHISYGSTFTTERTSLIATVPIGYADGYSRLLSSKGSMLVRGDVVPVVGRVCMDFTMIDVSDIPDVGLGDEVVVMGRQGNVCITADEIARLCGTINYEVASSLTRRMPLRHVYSKD